MVSFKKFLGETKRTGCTCWTGYKRVPGTKPCSPGSCVKEEVVLENNMDHSKDHKAVDELKALALRKWNC